MNYFLIGKHDRCSHAMCFNATNFRSGRMFNLYYLFLLVTLLRSFSVLVVPSCDSWKTFDYEINYLLPQIIDF